LHFSKDTFLAAQSYFALLADNLQKSYFLLQFLAFACT